MLECYRDKTTLHLGTVLSKERSPNAYIQKGSALLRLSKSTCLTWYRPTINSVVEQVRSLEDELRVDAIFVVGGFAECQIFIKELEEKFSKIQLVIPGYPGLAAIKGAVQYGPEPKAIASRSSYATYGVNSCTKFREGLHDASKRFWAADKNAYYCDDVFSVFVRKGEEVDPSKPYQQTYFPMRLQQTTSISS